MVCRQAMHLTRAEGERVNRRGREGYTYRYRHVIRGQEHRLKGVVSRCLGKTANRSNTHIGKLECREDVLVEQDHTSAQSDL